MGTYLNPGNRQFFRALNSSIYVDKTEMVLYLNSVVNTWVYLSTYILKVVDLPVTLCVTV